MPTPGDYRVLIVDDDFKVGELHASMVNEMPGFTALEPVQDSRTVPKVVAAQQPDLVSAAEGHDARRRHASSSSTTSGRWSDIRAQAAPRGTMVARQRRPRR